jgi:acetyl esterase/lipase
MKIMWIVWIAGLASFAQALETDDAYNRRIMANEVFYKADASGDYKLSQSDNMAWETYRHLDADADGSVSFDEFVEGADLPYPEWQGGIKRNVVYKRAGNEVLLMDIYAPRRPGKGKAPVFYYTHGGGWSGGSKELSAEVRPLFEALSGQGFVCVSVMYRLVKMWNPDDPVLMHDCVVDCRDGLRFLKKHEKELGLDMDRVVVFGSSAGGHIAQLLTWSGADDFAGAPALASFRAAPVAGISWFGPSDFRDNRLFDYPGSDKKFAPDHWAKRITKSNDGFCYDTADAKTRRMTEELSPVWWLNAKSAPLLHIHGDRDVVIPPQHAQHLKQKAAACGADITVQMVKGAGHGWWNEDIEPDRDALHRMTLDFVEHHAGRQLQHASPAHGGAERVSAQWSGAP